MLGDIQKLQKQAQDPILTGEERAKRGAELQEKVKEVRAKIADKKDLYNASMLLSEHPIEK
jgi:hypothetical protein